MDTRPTVTYILSRNSSTQLLVVRLLWLVLTNGRKSSDGSWRAVCILIPPNVPQQIDCWEIVG